MKRFEFRLDALLKLRRAAEDSAKRAFGAARTAAERQRDEVGRCASAEDAAKQGLRAASGGREIRVADVLAHQRFVAAQERRAAAERRRLADLEAAAAHARDAFVASSRDRKALDRLRERRLSEWTVEALREEQRETDDRRRVAGGER